MAEKSRFRIIEKPRKMVTYQITDSEMENIGSLTKIEQIILNFFFSMLGMFGGVGVTVLSGATNSAVWVAFWVSLILSIVLLLGFFAVNRSIKKMKSSITR